MAQEHKHGAMDTEVQEKTFAGFINWTTKTVIICILALVFIALVNGQKFKLLLPQEISTLPTICGGFGFIYLRLTTYIQIDFIVSYKRYAHNKKHHNLVYKQSFD